MTSFPTAPLRVLVVEDEGLIAMDIVSVVEDAGHQVVAEAISLHDVASLDDDFKVDLAFVDVQLAQKTSGIDVSRMIAERWPGTIVVFVTANPTKLPDDYAGAHGVIGKPFTTVGFRSAVSYLADGIIDPPPSSARPSSLVEAPAFAATWTH